MKGNILMFSFRFNFLKYLKLKTTKANNKIFKN